jgi:serine/threonine protein kinase
MFTLLTGYHPFDVGQSDEQLALDIVYNDFENEEASYEMSGEAMALIKRLLAYAPNGRPGAEEALSDPWFGDIRDKDLEMVEPAQPQEGSGARSE